MSNHTADEPAAFHWRERTQLVAGRQRMPSADLPKQHECGHRDHQRIESKQNEWIGDIVHISPYRSGVSLGEGTRPINSINATGS
jgi:hypothetical protein